MIRNIVAALDGSEESRAGLDLAISWAGIMDAELRGVFVEDERRFMHLQPLVGIEGDMPVPVPLPHKEMEIVQREVDKQADDVKAVFEEATAQTTLRRRFRRLRGEVNQVLTQQARGADIIVLGKRGVNDPPGLPEPGPTTTELVHSALRPVLVVPAGVRHEGPVLMAFDGGQGASRVIVPGLMAASALEQKVVVLTIKDDSAQAAEQQWVIKDYLMPYGPETTFIVEKGESRAAEVILRVADEIGAGLILMGAFSQNPLKEFFMGSTTMSVLEKSPCPLLMMA